MSADPDLARFGLAVGRSTDEAGAIGLTVIRGINGPFRAATAGVVRWMEARGRAGIPGLADPQ